jgi:hypothetical protein
MATRAINHFTVGSIPGKPCFNLHTREKKHIHTNQIRVALISSLFLGRLILVVSQVEFFTRKAIMAASCHGTLHVRYASRAYYQNVTIEPPSNVDTQTLSGVLNGKDAASRSIRS